MCYKILPRNFLITLFDDSVKRKKPESQHVVFHMLSTLCAIDIGRSLLRFSAARDRAPAHRSELSATSRAGSACRTSADAQAIEAESIPALAVPQIAIRQLAAAKAAARCGRGRLGRSAALGLACKIADRFPGNSFFKGMRMNRRITFAAALAATMAMLDRSGMGRGVRRVAQPARRRGAHRCPRSRRWSSASRPPWSMSRPGAPSRRSPGSAIP